MQIKGEVIKGWVGVPFTLTMEVNEGLVGPQNSGKAEKVMLVSMRRKIGLPSMRAVTLDSLEVMVVGRGSPGPRQSSAVVTSPKRSVKEEGWWGGLDPLPRGVEGQSITQWPSCLHFGHGLSGQHGLGHAWAQCPSRPH
jgi:hypothetical protein